MRKISNVKAIGSTIIAVQKKLSGKAITVVIRQLLLRVEVDEVKCQAAGISALND